MARARVHRSLALLLAAALALGAAAPPPHAARPRRQLDDNALQPLDDAAAGVAGQAAGREKRKLDGVAQASFGIKNAVLGLLFGKINSVIDAKTRLVETLDRTNIEKNRALGIEPPKDAISSLGGVFAQVVGPKLQLIGPGIQAVSGLLGSLSGTSAGASGQGGGAGSGGGGLGSILSLVSSLSGSSSGGAMAGGGAVDTIDSDEDDDDSS